MFISLTGLLGLAGAAAVCHSGYVSVGNQQANTIRSLGFHSLSVQRLRTLQEKKGAQAKASRRDIATLLERGKIETARIKVESIIHEDVYLELLELLELYCELLLARFGLVDLNTREPDSAVSEGVCSVIYAAPRTELKELHILRDLLMHKYGRDFSAAVMENRDGCVSDRVMKKLTNDTPSADLVEGYLTEIAKGYGVQWNSDLKQVGGDQNEEAQDLNSVETILSAAKDTSDQPSPSGPASGGRTPKLPDIPPTEDEDGKGGTKSGTESAPSKPSPEDDFAMLAKRFEALKKR
ncbi:regulator of Vps4 activity in the MVB pathway-domain-containing protein [Gloeopeniophorella convolvens]|nr:regulator of Vps4 activity in the MVB pathway-domain-containing protein [Gloeopeniophorella convolvens]